MRSFVVLAAVGCALSASTASVFADVVTDWNQAMLNAVASSSFNPPKASRAMAMMHAAVYDAVNAVDQTHNRYLYTGVAAPGTSREAAAAVAAHDVLTSVFGASATFDALRDNHVNAVADVNARNAGVSLGAAVATNMLAARASDGSTAVVPYTSPATPGVWRPTAPANAPALLPGWGQVTPFAMSAGSQFRPPPPPSMNSAAYTQAWDEVRRIGAVNSVERTQEQTDIARVWAGGGGTPTPPGQWNQIAQQLASSHANDISENARMFALLNLGLADAAIACWDGKYEFDLWRPITAIREADTDGNGSTTSDPTWSPLIPTPPFPAYTSGHSTFSRSAAEILKSFFGTDNVSFTHSALDAPGILRSFTSLDAAANEAGMSRIYGGIHFQFDNVYGQECGASIANWVTTHYLTAVPAPGSAVGLAGAGLIAIRRRRR